MSAQHAAASKGSCAHELPSVVYDLIAQHLSRDALALVRLSCRSFAAAPSITTAIRSITVESWSCPHFQMSAICLSHVQHMHAVVATPTDWSRMQQLALQLPELKSIHFTGRRSWYRMNKTDIMADVIDLSASSSAVPSKAGCSTSREANQAQLTSLRAVSFEGSVRGLDDIVALAPRLQQLQCDKLILPKNELHQEAPQLQHLTHFGSSYVHIDAQDTAEAAEAFAAAFPFLQVIFQTPEFGANVVILRRIDKTKVPLCALLSKCSTVHSVRIFGSSTSMCGFIPKQLQGLQHIKRLSVYGIGPAAELRGVKQLTQLRQLRLSFEVPTKRALGPVLTLLDELALLPQLQQLVLPAKLTCTLCCPWSFPAVRKLAQHCARNSCELIFLQRPAQSIPVTQQAGDFCPHGCLSNSIAQLHEACCTACCARHAAATTAVGSLPATTTTADGSAQLTELLAGAARRSLHAWPTAGAAPLGHSSPGAAQQPWAAAADSKACEPGACRMRPVQCFTALQNERQCLPVAAGVLQRAACHGSIGGSSSSSGHNTWDVFDAVSEWHVPAAHATPHC